jgi:cytochrome b
MPRHVIGYIRSRLAGDKTRSPGHAPTGAWATILLLAVLGGMASLGTMAHNDVLFEGPLAATANGYGAGGFSDTATDWHNALEPILFAVLAAHIVALLMYRLWLKINLVPAMVTGGEDKSPKPFSKTHQITGVILLLAMIAAAQCLGLIGERYYF